MTAVYLAPDRDGIIGFRIDDDGNYSSRTPYSYIKEFSLQTSITVAVVDEYNSVLYNGYIHLGDFYDLDHFKHEHPELFI